MHRSYYRSGGRRKKKKIIISDLELLNYSLDDLKKIISKTNKKLKCGKCERELAIESLSLSLDPFEKLHNTIKSGPHGIYYKCMQCGMNISIQTKIDFNEDPEIKKINQDIEDFQNSLRILKKNNKLLLKRLKEDNDRYSEIQNKKNKIDNERQLEIKTVRSKMNKLVYEWEKFSGRRGLGSHLLEVFTGIEPGYKEEIIGEDWVKIKDENINEFKKLQEKEREIEIKHLAAYTTMTNKNELKKMDDHAVYYRGLPKYIVWGLGEKKTNIEDLHSEWGYPDLENPKDLERVEDEILKPHLEKKNKRILLLRKIFRQTSGCIYILENDEMPGLYKVGWTERSPEERAKELSGTGLPTPYKVAYSKSTNLTADIEKTIHKNLDYCRLRSNREFFKADFTEIKKVVDKTLDNYN